ncbi:MAG: hypothetical protein ACMUEL_03475 [Flavobacteriales bacterium Tduv]
MYYFYSRGIKDRVQKKAYRNLPLSKMAILFNKLVSNSEEYVEHTFGSITVGLFRKGSSQRISPSAYPASYGGYGV